MSSPRDKAKHLVSVPSADRWTIGTKQSMGRTVPMTLEQYATRQLGRPITHCTICSQLMAQRDNKKLTIQTPDGKQAKNNMGREEDNSADSHQMTPRYKGSPQQGTRVYQTRATPHGRKGQNQIYTLCPRNIGLARRGKSPNTLPHVKTCAQKIQTISHQESSIRCLIRTRTSSAMEDTPGDPCKPLDTL